MLKIDNVSFSYDDGTIAVNNVSLEVQKEHIFAILGLSGSGKTTLLNCIAKFLTPQKGTISINNSDILSLDNKSFRKKIGVVFQHLNLFPHKTVLENLTLAPQLVQSMSKKEAEKEAIIMLEKLGIDDLSSSYPSQISGGQAQRVAIARGLMLKPDYMLLDEPTSALDPKTTNEFAMWLKELQSDSSFIIVTHDIAFAELSANSGVFMNNGEIIKKGSIKEIVGGYNGNLGHSDNTTVRNGNSAREIK